MADVAVEVTWRLALKEDDVDVGSSLREYLTGTMKAMDDFADFEI